MRYLKFHVDNEVQKILAGRPSLIDPAILLHLVWRRKRLRIVPGVSHPVREVTDKQAYTPAEVAALMGFSIPTVIRMFEREPGVLMVAHPGTMHKRRYRSLRIPRAVYERVVRRISV